MERRVGQEKCCADGQAEHEYDVEQYRDRAGRRQEVVEEWHSLDGAKGGAQPNRKRVARPAVFFGLLLGIRHLFLVLEPSTYLYDRPQAPRH